MLVHTTAWASNCEHTVLEPTFKNLGPSRVISLLRSETSQGDSERNIWVWSSAMSHGKSIRFCCAWRGIGRRGTLSGDFYKLSPGQVAEGSALCTAEPQTGMEWPQGQVMFVRLWNKKRLPSIRLQSTSRDSSSIKIRAKYWGSVTHIKLSEILKVTALYFVLYTLESQSLRASSWRRLIWKCSSLLRVRLFVLYLICSYWFQ